MSSIDHGSAGVNTADITAIPNNACRCLLLKPRQSITPIRARKAITIGSSKAIPNPKIIFVMKLMYFSRSHLLGSSGNSFAENSNTTGVTIKYANVAPIIKNITIIIKSGRAYFFSLIVSAGNMNAHS